MQPNLKLFISGEDKIKEEPKATTALGETLCTVEHHKDLIFSIVVYLYRKTHFSYIYLNRIEIDFELNISGVNFAVFEHCSHKKVSPCHLSCINVFHSGAFHAFASNLPSFAHLSF